MIDLLTDEVLMKKLNDQVNWKLDRDPSYLNVFKQNYGL